MFPTSNAKQTTSWIQAMRIMIRLQNRRPIPWTWVQETKFARSTSTGMDRRRVKSYHTLRSQWPLFHIQTTKGLKHELHSKSKVENPVHSETDPTSFADKATSQKSNPYPSLEKKVRRLPVTLLMIKLWILKRHLMWLLVSTYLFVRCNNHKSVWHLCEEVSWIPLELKLVHLCLQRCLNCSWLILVQVPLYLEICIPFFSSPLPPSPLSLSSLISQRHLIHTTHSYWYTHDTQFRRQHLQFLRLGLTRDLVWYIESNHTIPSGLSDLCFTFRRPKVLNMSYTRNPKLRILFTARRIQHLLQTRPRAKNPTHILVWRKRCAACLLHCLWLSFEFWKDTWCDCLDPRHLGPRNGKNKNHQNEKVLSFTQLRIYIYITYLTFIYIIIYINT